MQTQAYLVNQEIKHIFLKTFLGLLIERKMNARLFFKKLRTGK